jgi:hypothetical protein
MYLLRCRFTSRLLAAPRSELREARFKEGVKMDYKFCVAVVGKRKPDWLDYEVHETKSGKAFYISFNAIGDGFVSLSCSEMKNDDAAMRYKANEVALAAHKLRNTQAK